MWLPFLSLIAAIAAAPFLSAVAAAQSTKQIEQAARDTINELGLQTDLPIKDDSGSWMLDLPALGLSTELFWIALAVIVALMLYQMRDELPSFILRRTGRWREDNAAAALSPGEDGDIDPSMTSDELAKQGRYIEAMHWLLLRSLAEIRERLGVRFPDSMTSREILRRANLPADGKRMLQDIISRVELSYFGDYPAGEQDYAACRTSFEQLLGALQTQQQTSAQAS